MRIIQGKFWIVRLMRRSEGVYIVPNALNAFTLFEGCFAILWVIYVGIVVATYHYHSASLQHHIDAFNLIVWIPLYLGALYAAVGSFYTAPGSLDGRAVQKQWFFHRVIRRPMVINSISVGIPLGLIGGVTPCAVLAQRALSRNFVDYQSFSQRVQDSIGSSNAAVAPSQYAAFVREADAIWNNLAQGKRYLGDGYAVWTAFAALLLLFYIPAGGYMLALVKQQVNLQKERITRAEQNNLEIIRAEEKQHLQALQAQQQQEKRAASDRAKFQEDQPGAGKTHGGLEGLLFQPLAKKLSGDPPTYESRPRRASSTVVDGSPSAWPLTAGATEGQDVQEGRKVETGSSGDVYFPPLKPRQRRREHYQLSADAGPVTRHKYLRRCFRTLTVLYLGIIAAATIYLVVAGRLAAHMFPDTLQGPDESTYLVMTSHMPAAWAAAVFGFLTVGAVFFRWFDPAQPLATPGQQNQNRSPQSRGSTPRDKMEGQASNQGARPVVGSKGQGTNDALAHLQERTLPAVPEGVSQSQSGQILSGEAYPDFPTTLGAAPSPGRTMKFRLGKDGRKPGALFMMPDAGGQSSIGDPEQQVETTMSSRSWLHRFGFGARPSTSRDAYGAGVPEDVTHASSVCPDELASRPDWAQTESTATQTPLGLPAHHRDISLESNPARPASWALQRELEAHDNLDSIALPMDSHRRPGGSTDPSAGPASGVGLDEPFHMPTSHNVSDAQQADIVFPFGATHAYVPQNDLGELPDHWPAVAGSQHDDRSVERATNGQPPRVDRSGSVGNRNSSTILFEARRRRASIPPPRSPPVATPLPQVPTSPAFAFTETPGFGFSPNSPPRVQRATSGPSSPLSARSRSSTSHPPNVPSVLVIPPGEGHQSPNAKHSYDFF